jgi:cobalt-zinc-cadmium resistance protein CzcA
MSTDGASRLERGFAWILPRRGWVVGLALLGGAAGALTFAGLHRDLFPDLTLPTVQLLIQSPGRTASELELTVAQPVEQALGGLPGVERVTSTVQEGVVQVVVAFAADSDPWRSRQLIAEKLAGVAGAFPAGTSPPLATSAAGRLQEIQELVLEGPSVDPLRLRDHAVQVLVPRLQALPGVARVELLGGEERQLQVTLLPERLRLMGAGLDPVLQALAGSERDAAAGVLEIQDKAWFVTLASRAARPEEVQRLPVHTAHGLVPLGELAEVREGPGFRQGLARYQGYEVVSLRVVKQPSAETLATARAVRAALPELRRSLPAGMRLDLFYDQGRLVEHALGGVLRALGAGALLVALVLLFFLGSWRAAGLVIVLLPLAVFGAALPLRALGLGLNAMTLGGLAIAVGLLVDSGVIMVENLVHRLEAHRLEGRGLEARSGEGAAPRLVLAAAAAEVAPAILTAVLAILAVFLPLLALGGIAGRLYAPLATAVAAAMTGSLVLSFTLVPALAERWLAGGAAGKRGDISEPRRVRALKRAYRPLLAAALRHPGAVLAGALAVALPSFWLALHLGSDFLPRLDEGALMLNTSLPAATSLQAVDDANRALERELGALPGVAAHYRRTGRSEITEDPMPHYLSDVLVILAPGAVAARVEAEVAEVAERLPFGVEITTPMGMRIAEGIGGTPADLQVKLFHPDLEALAARAPALLAVLTKVEGVASATVDSGGALPEWRVTPDDEALRRLDVPRPLLLATVRAALQGIPLEPRFEGAQRIERIVRFPSDGRVTAESLKRLPLVVEEGKIVELGQVATIAEAATPDLIRREGGQRRLGINLRTAGDLGGTARRVEAVMAGIAAKEAGGVDLPPGTSVRLGGRIEQARETSRRLTVAIAVALALVAGLLYLALRRWREVGLVVATLPFAFAGGLFALWLAGETWNVSSIVGVIGLFGVAVQNSLVLIAQTQGLARSGLPFADAVREASLGRVRPKLMTAGSATLGLLPMLCGFGGSELERPLAIVMVGGLVTSTLFTLLALPSFYLWVGPDGRRRSPLP